MDITNQLIIEIKEDLVWLLTRTDEDYNLFTNFSGKKKWCHVLHAYVDANLKKMSKKIYPNGFLSAMLPHITISFALCIISFPFDSSPEKRRKPCNGRVFAYNRHIAWIHSIRTTYISIYL